MNATGIGTVEDALLGFLGADVILAALEGPPALGPPSRLLPHHVWIAPNIEATDITELSDGLERLETFALEVRCFAQATGSDFVTARDASAALADRVAIAVVGNHDLGLGVGLYDVHVTGVERDYMVADKTEGVLHTVRVTAQVILA